MQLDHFLSETIVQIVNGLKDADQKVAGTGAMVNPPDVVGEFFAYDQQGDWRPRVERVEFDIVVSASKNSETKGGIGVQVGVVGLGSAGKSNDEHSSESRVKFTIPILFPLSKNTFERQG